MIYYETLLMFFIVLTVIPILVGFIVRNKPIRYFCWLISLPLFLLIISTINKHSSDVNKQTSEFLGNYVIDTSKSVYKFGNLANYRTLTMTVKSDNTFEFSDTSMFPSKKGSWKFYNTEDGGFVKCNFPDKTYETLVFTGNGYWGFQDDCFRNGNNGDAIYFQKQSTDYDSFDKGSSQH